MDWVHLMAYDLEGDENNYTGIHAILRKTDEQTGDEIPLHVVSSYTILLYICYLLNSIIGASEQ